MMEFGSEYVYNYSDSEDEVVSEDEYDEGMMPNLDGAVPSSPPPSSAVTETRSDGPVAAGAPPRPPPPPARSKKGGRFGLASLFGSKAKSSQLKSKKKSHWLSLSGSDSSRTERADPGYTPAGRRWRRADTNIVAVKFDQLTAPCNMHTGDPVPCNACQAVLSSISTLSGDGEDRVWVCEFCSENNVVDIVDDEIPHQEDVTYMLKPALSTTASGRLGTDESLVIFCVDTSGSMCVTTEVPGKIRFRGDRLDRLQSLNETRENQFMPGQSRNITYVSRLQGVQAAVNHQLGEMAKDHPNRRSALVSFSTEVTVVGDGSCQPVHFSGDKLSDYEALMKAGSELSLPASVKKSRHVLGDKVFDLEEGGQTALGPALLLCVSMACQVPGSKVIICTDGLANVGLGSLDLLSNDDIYGETVSFYGRVSQMAVDKGVSVSLISIKGTDCRMAELGRVADTTGGQVNIVDPLKLTEEFGSILADPIIATNVSATLLLHKGLYFRNYETEGSMVVRNIGNVTRESEITFEFGVRKQEKKSASCATKPKRSKAKATSAPTKPPSFDNPVYGGEEVYDFLPGLKKENEGSEGEQVYDNATEGQTEGAQPETDVPSSGAQAGLTRAPLPIEELKELPFQLRIEYTDLEGARALRVLTQRKPVTKDRNQAESAMNVPAIGLHATQQSARWALEGKYTASRMNAFMHQRLVHRRQAADATARPAYEAFYDNVSGVEHRCNMMQKREVRTYGSRLSDDESSDEDQCMDETAPAVFCGSAATAKEQSTKAPTIKCFKKKSVSEKTLRQRTRDCLDDEASTFYQQSKLSSKAFK